MAHIQWTDADIPDLTGKCILITGATSGLGRAEAEMLARKGAALVFGVRNISKAQAVAKDIREATPGAQIIVRELDLASLTSINRFACGVMTELSTLDVLVNNAGVMVPPYGHTEDGFELQMGTNHFGTFALTGLLLPLLRKTPGARITVTSSIAHKQGDPDLSDLDWTRRKYNAWKAYGDSKIANLLFAYELVRRLGSNGPKVVAAHPGWTRTDLQRHSGIARFLNPLMGMPLAQGVLSPLRAATDPDAQTGDFFGPTKLGQMRGYPERVEPKALARDPDLAAALWEISAERTGVTYHFH
ncbi:oxidoreductase [Celeribacter litoreus]|uniref:oxidoreductase n=1 Tax=Celeribacter litoreus TaxID=2876714 RepID=UPI001CCD2585|nr:oxidoreductase [Celeribacter litoreus]MCA0042726.1 SDR family NAD(P)-dependent oxidoreductase [Celeribacter litoreus]